MVTLTDGDNTFDQDEPGEQRPDTINALGGDDLILTSTLGGSEVFGGEGNDSLRSRGPSGVGNSGLADTLRGGPGDDSLDFQAASGFGFGLGGNDTLVAASRTSLYGGDGDDFFRGLIGDNWFSANQGDDIIVIGQRDSIYGGRGEDTIAFSVGGDIPSNLDAESLATQSSVTRNQNFISANRNADFVAAWGSNDTIFGGKENDTIYSLGSEVRASGDDGDDVIINLNREIDADDIINSTSTGLTPILRSTLLGGEGDDSIQGAVGPLNDGRNYLDGEAGNDTIVGQASRDTLLGGAGDDFLETGLLPENQDKVSPSGIELTTEGFAGNNRLDGGAGNDTLVAGFITDTMIGGVGNDCLTGIFNNADGGVGDDTIDATNTGTSVTEITLIGGAGDDRLLGNSTPGVANLTNYFNGGSGNDFIQFGTTNDQLIGNTDGDDTINGPETTAGTGISIIDTEGSNVISVVNEDDTPEDGRFDTLVTGSGDDSISAGDGNDSLVGGAGNDTIFGRAGTDTIVGGAGDDYIVGGLNSTGDSLIGGAGSDTFVFFGITNAENSVIVDFDPDDDSIVILDEGFGLVNSSPDQLIAANDFVSVPSGDNYENSFARTTNPVIVYERSPLNGAGDTIGSGLLKYDPSGSGSPSADLDDLTDVSVIARLNGNPDIERADILII